MGCLLPFDEDTASSDQSLGRVVTVAVPTAVTVAVPTASYTEQSKSTSKQQSLCDLQSQSKPLAVPRITSCLSGGVLELESLISRAVALRRLIRVKIADDADIDQVSCCCCDHPSSSFTDRPSYLFIPYLHLQAIAASSMLNSFFDRVTLLSARLLLQPSEVLAALETR